MRERMTRSRDPQTPATGQTIAPRVSSSQAPLAQAWQRHSEPGAAAGAEAVVAPPGPTRPGCARSRQGTEFAGSRFRSSTVTFVRRHRPYQRLPRSGSPGCCSARASGHLIAAALSAPFPFHKPGAGCAAYPRCWRSRRTAISSSHPIEQTPTSGCISSSRRRRTRTRPRRLSLRLGGRLCSPARTPRCRSSSQGAARPAMNATPHFSGLQKRPCSLGSSRSSDRQASGRLLFALAEKSALSVASKASLRCRDVSLLEQGGVARDRWSSSTPATSIAPAAAARVTYDAKAGTVEGNRISDCHDACKGGGGTSASARCWCMSSPASVGSSTSAGLGNNSAPRSSGVSEDPRSLSRFDA